MCQGTLVILSTVVSRIVYWLPPDLPQRIPIGLQIYCGHLSSSLLTTHSAPPHQCITVLSPVGRGRAWIKSFWKHLLDLELAVPSGEKWGEAVDTFLLWVQDCWVGYHSCKGSKRTPFVYSLHRTALSSIRRTSLSKYGFLSMSLGLGLW